MTISARDLQPDISAYSPAGNECALFETAWTRQLPLLLKGPTGCGKTRFVSHMAEKLGLPLTTVSCHDDLAAAAILDGRLAAGDTAGAAAGMAARAQFGQQRVQCQARITEHADGGRHARAYLSQREALTAPG